jgi:sporulation integral membrane protein YlbJ
MRKSDGKLNKHNLCSGLLGVAVLFLLLAMLVWPEQTYLGALQGLEVWATILVPSLFPFFILAEVLLGFGIIHFLGILLEPLMRPLFNLPGAASFVVAMGFTSGFPMGAVLTKRLCEEKQCTLAEGTRLVAFTNNASPLFILVAVAVGMFHNPFWGIILALAHYLANLLIGIFLGLCAPRQARQPSSQRLLRKSIRTLFEAQKKRPPWALLMSTAIKTGLENICLIGGFVVVFSIIINLLQTTGIQSCCTMVSRLFLSLAGLAPNLDNSFATGFWEMTLGLQNLSLATAPMRDKAILAGMILGWSGLSIQAQVTGVLSGSGISTRLFYRCRIIQGLLSGIITYLLTINNDRLFLLTAPVLTATPLPHSPLALFCTNFLAACHLFAYSMATLLFLALFCLLFTSLPAWAIRKTDPSNHIGGKNHS